MINLSDRIKEISYSTGTGDFILGGAFTGFSNFGSAYSYGAILYYAISDGTNYEIGSGEYLFSAPNRLLRRYPFKSTNSNNKVNFPAGTKEVYVTYPGEKAVFTAANLSDFSSPQNSGVAFWRSNQILDYDINLTWDYNNNRLGVSNSAPQYSIDVGGRNFIRSSGFIVGASGVTFPQQDLVYSGGVQKEPFLRNQTDVTTGTNLVFGWSGLVSETLTFKKQSCKTFLAGPSGCLEYDYPTFRPLYIEDVPDLSSLYVTQTGTGGAGQVAFYENNRVIGYDSFFVWDKNNNYLGVNRQNPTRSLDVNGNAIVNGYLDVNSLNTSGQIFFSSGNTPPVGTMRWDDGEGTVALGLKGGEIELEIGQEQVALCYNGTGSNISKGKVVYIIGAQGQRPSIALASNSTEITSSKTFGVVAEDIDAGQEGFVATYGVVRNINTNSFIEGSGLWLGTNGNMTMTRPTQPAHGVHIGYVMKKSASAGRIFVRVQNGFQLDEIHNVLISSVASGDLLQYDSSSQLWKNRSSQSIQYATGSGLTLVGNTLHTAGSGNFRYISFGGDSQANILIQTNGSQFTPSQRRIIAIGALAGTNLNPGCLQDINIGFGAGYAVNGYFNVNIGPNRTAAESTNQVSINIGGLAGERVSAGGYDNNIGYMAGQRATQSYLNNNIGAYSNIDGQGANNNNIGAATFASGDINNNIGPYNRSIGNVNNLIGYFNISSGNYNNIIGFEIVNSGNYNIAIGSSISIVANNRLNLGKTIAGHLESGRIYIGSVTDTNLFPRSTLELIPKSANDKVLIVNAHSSQSANLQDWNNRFGTTITFVDSSGIINANSGIILTPGTPSVTTNRIYNIGGALYFNGVALAGGYTSWTISDSGGNSESVTNGTNIIFSGANGVATVYNPTTNVMMVSGTNLGGGGSYNWRIADSGGAADTIANNELVIFSGVNGIGTIYNPTTNVMVLSGINPYSSWTLADSGGNSKNIVNNTQVIFSGVNGVATVYNPVANTMMVSGTQNAFSTISIAGQSDVVADSITDTLTLIAGTNITLSTNASQDSITINSTAGGGGSYNWRIADSGGVPDTIISDDLVMFSGVNGIATNYNPVNNVMTLSGNYSWTLRDSGNNSKAITNNTPVIFSGVNGVATVYNPTTNIMMVSGTNLGGSYSWSIRDSGTSPADTIANGETVMFSGANGIATIYNATNNVMTVSGAYTAGSGIILTGNQISLSGNNIISSSGFASSAFIQTSGAFITQDSSFTLSGIHNGKTIRSSGNSQINVTVSGNLPIGFGVSFIQTGPASIFYSGAPGVTIRNRQGHTKSAGLWSVTSLIEYNDNIFVLTGDTGT